MFIQVIEGKVADEGRLRAQLARWTTDLMPAAYGYLGSTGGITREGSCILVVRFATEDDARRNNDRLEQGAWWAETRTCFEGEIRFHETTDVHVMRHGDPDAAGFVQVLEGHVTDREAARRLDALADDALAVVRPDLLETITAYHPDGEFTEVAYFRSEAEARRGEEAEVPPELADDFALFEATMPTERYLDLREPWLASPRT
ncbi:MAG TPA: hypothetical protein VIY72_13560 [Acidimicrobiales bacterium]